MKSFVDHIKLECQFLAEKQARPNPFLKTWLSEGQGIPDQLDNMLRAILTAPVLQKTFQSWLRKPTEDQVCKFDMYGRTKDVKRNFIGPDSYLVVRVTKSRNGVPDCEGVYEGSGKSRFNRESGLLENAGASFTFEATEDLDLGQMLVYFKYTLAHELVHAFEDFNRQCEGKPDLNTTLANRRYKSVEDEKDPLQWMTYLLDPSEQKAYIAQAVSEVQDAVKYLKKAGRLDMFENIRNLDNVLKFTQFWATYESTRDWIENMQWNRLPEFRQKKYVEDYNKLVQGDLASPHTRPVKNYNQFLKKIQHRWSEFDQKMRVKVGQAVARALYTEKPKDPHLVSRKLSESIIYRAY